MSDKAAYFNASFVTEGGAYFVALVERNSPGYSQTTYTFATTEEALACVKSVNDSLGLTDEQAQEIVASSFAAQNARDE